MILHSIIPAEEIFKGQAIGNSQSEFVEINYLGEKVEVALMMSGDYVVNRVISTSPKAYLNPKLQPGSKIDNFLI